MEKAKSKEKKVKEEKTADVLPTKPRISPLEMFFALGDKVTKGDPQRKADYDYYMLWIIFLAFFGIFFGNLRSFFSTREYQFLGWALFGLAIMWFQYFNLKMSWQMRRLQKKARIDAEEQKDEDSKNIESVEDMLKEFIPKEEIKKDELPNEQTTTEPDTKDSECETRDAQK